MEIHQILKENSIELKAVRSLFKLTSSSNGYKHLKLLKLICGLIAIIRRRDQLVWLNSWTVQKLDTTLQQLLPTNCVNSVATQPTAFANLQLIRHHLHYHLTVINLVASRPTRSWQVGSKLWHNGIATSMPHCHSCVCMCVCGCVSSCVSALPALANNRCGSASCGSP